jgi:hypothetical protein
LKNEILALADHIGAPEVVKEDETLFCVGCV